VGSHKNSPVSLGSHNYPVSSQKQGKWIAETKVLFFNAMFVYYRFTTSCTCGELAFWLTLYNQRLPRACNRTKL
jgi:hypothetical protein